MNDSSTARELATIRPATNADVPAIEELIPRSVRALSAGFYAPELTEIAIEHLFGVDRQLIADGTYFVAECEGEFAGCGGWSRRLTLHGGDKAKPAGQVDRELDPKCEAARVRAFYVDPRFARRGIGSQLMHRCESEARAAGFTRVEIVATLPGEQLYSRFGYQRGELVEIPLPGGQFLPAVHLFRSLA